MSKEDSITSSRRSETMDGIGSSGLVISTTDAVQAFLTTSSEDLNLTKELRDLASSLTQQPSVSYKSIKSIWTQCDSKTRPNLLSLLAGSSFIFTSPKPREKSEELQARLRKLAVLEEKREYAELVKDITPRTPVVEPFSSYKDQLGFGLHVAVTMFTGYLVGYAAFRALFNRNVAMNAAGGILGLVVAMLVEMLLFIIRFSDHEQQPKPSSTSETKKDQ